ncbi:MAG: hypothetical protein A2151_07880 [Candidatus Muproteobacteria bacterium RBG_16_65_34]|uniref:Transglycosylase SLT domain-containing protein n=1 Tax=Candidatus Muproteobacteria bacterium RBG_16_65_34 TaxID=1817760 RepID=A0A1F6TQI5_9PROT|nr:MAG: hypothetical protein A2151_07880 [Candidatus Muproteobacteria bacterium RBG_16_65_34]
MSIQPVSGKCLMVAGLFAFLASGTAQAERMFVYELPDGTRMITDHALDNKHYRLVRVGETAKGMGQLVASRSSQFFRSDSSAYDHIIRKLAARHEVDFALVKAIMHVESAFNPYAASDKGAVGLMQVLPETAKRYGVENVYDPEENIRAGVRYLKFLLELFDHKNHLAIAAYNAGENAVLRHGGIPPYTETQLFVRKVLRYKRQYAKS